MGHYTLQINISRLMAVLLCFVLLLSAVPPVFADGESGTLGSNLQWSLSGGTLTITGTGDMVNIPETERAPWYELRDQIYQVILPEGLTSIGNMAFYECHKLQMVVIPDSVTLIGDFAFAYCSNLEMLTLGKGVVSIGESAFSDCYRMAFLDLPGSLRTIGKKAFYRCEAITTVTIPSSVTNLGAAAFGYCKSLVSATVLANVTELPALLFYGCDMLTSVTLPDSVDTLGSYTFLECDSLHTVYYNGTTQEPEAIQKAIGRDVPAFRTEGEVTDGNPGASITSGTAKEQDDGTPVYENTTVTKGDDTTVSSHIQHTTSEGEKTGSTTADITVTITGANGWDEAEGAVQDAITSANDIAQNSGNPAPNTEVTVYVTGTDSIDRDFIDSFTGQDVTVNVVTQNGSIWKFKGTELEKQGNDVSYDLRYEVTQGSAELCEELETTQCYVIRFMAPATINAEVMIQLSSTLALQNATLFERSGDLAKIQSSVIDMDGYAHFYLASVSDKSEYYIALNIKEAEDTAIIPEVIQAAYGKPEYVEPIKYEITGRKSSWGMTFSQVTWIMAAVLGGCVVLVGIVMYVLNKRKLRMGYVPDLEDEEYDYYE